MDYTKFYERYKKLPKFYLILSIIITLILAIAIDISAETEGLLVFIGALLATPLALLVRFVTALIISPTIIRTDAVIKIQEKLINKD